MKYNLKFLNLNSPFRMGDKNEKLSLSYILTGLIFIIITAYVLHIPPKKPLIDRELKVGEIVKEDIVIENDVTIEDKEATEKRRLEAINAVIPIYEFYPDRKAKTITAISDLIEYLRNKRKEYIRNQLEIEDVSTEIKEKFDIEISKNHIIQFFKSREIYSKLDINRLAQFLGVLYDEKGIILSKSGARRSKDDYIMVPAYKSAAENKLIKINRFYDLADIRSELPKHLRAHDLRSADIAILTSALIQFIDINYSYSKTLTQAETDKVLEELIPSIIKLKTGQIILRKGDKVESKDLKIIRAIAVQEDVRGKLVPDFYLIFILLLFLFASMDRLFKKWSTADLNRDKLMIVSSITLLMGSIIYRISVFLFPLILKNLSISVSFDTSSTYFAIPFGFIALVVAFSFSLQSAVAVSFMNAIMAGIICNWDLKVTLYALIGNLVVSFAIESYQRLSRNSIFKAAFFGLLPVNLLLIILFFITKTSFNFGYLATNLVMGIFSVLASALLASFIIPLWEIIFKLITDLKLSELSNLNLPIFRDMLEKAPGTYHHSQMVASLSETAAIDLGLSAPLLTSMALYHDIGKIENPQFFTENHTIYKNPHQHMSPPDSAKNILSHIADGIETAKELKLPQLIADSIEQHHGTKLLKFFYDKALGLSSVNSDDFDDKIYKYPGPKPRNLENAIVMLADQVEAATKSLESFSSEEIQNVINEIIISNIEEGQFDDCEGLTFKALNIIANSFLKKLSSIYHKRISYPGFDFTKKNNHNESSREGSRDNNSKNNGTLTVK